MPDLSIFERGLLEAIAAGEVTADWLSPHALALLDAGLARATQPRLSTFVLELTPQGRAVARALAESSTPG